MVISEVQLCYANILYDIETGPIITHRRWINKFKVAQKRMINREEDIVVSLVQLSVVQS